MFRIGDFPAMIGMPTASPAMRLAASRIDRSRMILSPKCSAMTVSRSLRVRAAFGHGAALSNSPARVVRVSCCYENQRERKIPRDLFIGGTDGPIRIVIPIYVSDSLDDLCRLLRDRDRVVSDDRRRNDEAPTLSHACIYRVWVLGSGILHATSFAGPLRTAAEYCVEGVERRDRIGHSDVLRDVPTTTCVNGGGASSDIALAGVCRSYRVGDTGAVWQLHRNAIRSRGWRGRCRGDLDTGLRGDHLRHRTRQLSGDPPAPIKSANGHSIRVPSE
jgi:hypothetical protein